jgi:hypothetical protein
MNPCCEGFGMRLDIVAGTISILNGAMATPSVEIAPAPRQSRPESLSQRDS